MAEHENDPWGEHLSVKLSNPDEEREIDELILQELWPGVVQALRGSRLTTWIGVNNTPAEGLETLHHQYITRSLTFVIEDPARPIRPGISRPWYCRFVIRASLFDYMLSKTTLLMFPENFSMRKLTRFLMEPRMQGCPPKLSWQGRIEGSGEYQVALDTGEGASWGPRSRVETREYIRETVEDHLAVIGAMERLAQDWKDTKAFNTLYDLAVGANLAY